MISKTKSTENNQGIGSKKNTARLREMLSALKRHGIIHGVSPEKLKLILEDLGPTYVKLGQLMSMRNELLPKDYCHALAELRTDVKPIPYEEITRIIEAEYAQSAAEIFLKIFPECLGSASIAQVHKCILKNGKTVVLKIQRPGIYETMERDIRLLKNALSLLKILNINVGRIDFKMFIDEMWTAAQQEMDFIAEANYIREFTELNADIAYVTFPHVEWNLTTPRVLVMEYIDGVQIDDLENLKVLGYDLNEIGIKLAENYVKQIVDDGLFHADPHPGNIYIREGKIVWIDLGMVGRINHHDRMLLKKIIQAIVRQDIEGLKELFLTMDTIKGKVNHPKLYEDIESLLTRYGNMDLASLQLAKIMEEVKDILDFHQISLPRGISMLGRGMITIEGILAVYCPQVNLIQIMANHISGKLLKETELKQELMATTLLMNSFVRNSLTLPEQFSNIIKMALRGQAKINIELSSSAQFARRADIFIDKLIICLLSASFIIGSSILSASQITPGLFGIPLLGLAGYVIALILAGWLIIKIIRSKESKK
ncbi:MAG TPA: AarF/UbiB family protein [Desulfitobacteriaceae bacterium]|nr:AarF/UbiB family protein [Desulfitobacteriaceae bacterium]